MSTRFTAGTRCWSLSWTRIPTTYSRFQFSVLQILPRSTTPEAVVAVEAIYKAKLLSKQFGLNAN